MSTNSEVFSHRDTISIALLKNVFNSLDQRYILTPEGVNYIKNKYSDKVEIYLEVDSSDEVDAYTYENAGAKLCMDRELLISNCNMVLSTRLPELKDEFYENKTFVGFFDPLCQFDSLLSYMKPGIYLYSLDLQLKKYNSIESPEIGEVCDMTEKVYTNILKNFQKHLIEEKQFKKICDAYSCVADPFSAICIEFIMQYLSENIEDEYKLIEQVEVIKNGVVTHPIVIKLINKLA